MAAELGENLHVRGDVHDVIVEQVLVLLLGSGFQILQAGDGLRCHILIGNTALLQPDVLAQNPAEHGQAMIEEAAGFGDVRLNIGQVEGGYGKSPFLGGGFGHFYHYAPVKIEYAINRFTMEAKRLLDVLDKQLAQHKFIAGDEYTIADMAIWPWFGNVVLGGVYDAAEFLDAGSYKHVQRWAKEVGERPAVKRGRIVNRTNGPLNEQLHERHDASDFETNTEDKRQG